MEDTTFAFEAKIGNAILKGDDIRCGIIAKKTDRLQEKMRGVIASFCNESLDHSISFKDYVNCIQDIDDEMAWEDVDVG